MTSLCRRLVPQIPLKTTAQTRRRLLCLRNVREGLSRGEKRNVIVNPEFATNLPTSCCRHHKMEKYLPNQQPFDKFVRPRSSCADETGYMGIGDACQRSGKEMSHFEFSKDCFIGQSVCLSYLETISSLANISASGSIPSAPTGAEGPTHSEGDQEKHDSPRPLRPPLLYLKTTPC